MTHRIAIVDQAKCNPTKCKKECIKYCPPQSRGIEVINIIDIEDINKSTLTHNNLTNLGNLTKRQIAQIVEQNCIGCNICIKKCPFEAIKIINLPSENKKDIIHRYNMNGFRLYKLPELKKNTIIGFVGENGIGKTSLINILTKNIIPNFEKFDINYTTKDICSKFRGSVLYNYLQNLYSNKLRITIKPQKIKQDKSILIQKYLEENNISISNEIIDKLELRNVINSNTNIDKLSGGELQRLLCLNTLTKDADVYIFDEPTNYLDIKQRLIMVKLIREIIMKNENSYVLVIDHDLSMLDYACDEIYILYGKAGAYGIISNPLSIYDGLNMYLDGFIPNENVRFRDEEFNLKPSLELDKIEAQKIKDDALAIEYPESFIKYDSFELHIKKDKIKLNSSINVILGENGVGKTTFVNFLAEKLELPISYKEQTLNIQKYKNKDGIYPTVEEVFYKYIQSSYVDTKFIHEVVKPLDCNEIKNRKLNELSGGELQKVLIILCLGTPADIYLIDEPSANLDIEKRLKVIKIIKNYILNNNKCAFIIEHDIMMAVAFAQEYTSNILLINKKLDSNKRISMVSDYMNFNNGITQFLKSLDITMRLSSHNRPRINKYQSQLDREQRLENKYYQ